MSSYGLEVIGREECRALLASQRVGRVGLCGTHPGVFPVLYALLDGDVVFRTAPGEKLMAAALEREVVFEVDAFSTAACTGWSINVLGVAAEIEHPDELGQAQALDLPSWAGELRDRYVRIRALEVSGRRIVETVLAGAST
jgi:nitroimidazol reductase NimA-like FMN-containing flavoprotein (pyridoxamine 5'-phosphate oxidase superfamily)